MAHKKSYRKPYRQWWYTCNNAKEDITRSRLRKGRKPDARRPFTNLTFMRNARVEAVVKSVALEIDLFGNGVVERIVGQVVSVELAGQIRIVHVIDLRNSSQVLLGRVVGYRRRSVTCVIVHLLCIPNEVR